jgi:acetyl esterase/lipase
MRPSTSLKRWLSLRAYGLVTSTLFGPDTQPEKMRTRFERFGAIPRAVLQRKFPHLRFEDHAAGPLAIEAVRAVPSPRCVILHLHGGAFLMGSRHSYRNRAMRLSYRCNAEVFVPEYRLAPDHPYPTGMDDALAAWHYVRTVRPGLPILVTGDSAGGCLGLGLLVRLRDRGDPMPAGAILLSPWTDLTLSGRSIESNRRRDLWFTRRHLQHWARLYLAGADARAPAVSPVFADLGALPPLLLLAGEDELLLDDAVRVGDSAAKAGTTTRVVVGAGMQHDWPLTLPWLEESRSAWADMQRFVEHVIRKESPQ